MFITTRDALVGVEVLRVRIADGAVEQVVAVAQEETLGMGYQGRADRTGSRRLTLYLADTGVYHIYALDWDA